MVFGDGIVLLFCIVLWVWAVVDTFMSDPERIRSLQKAIWVLITLLFGVLGAVAWIIFGRPRRSAQAAVPRGDSVAGYELNAPRRRSGPTAPDDDPEFLHKLGDDIKRDRPDDPPHG